jgi:hypothetical protein
VFFFNYSAVADGQYPVKVTAYDTAGNSAIANTTIAINNTTPADTVKPTVSVPSPAEGAVISGTVAPFTVNAADNVAIALVDTKIDTTASIIDTTSPYNGTINTTQYADGPHSLTVEVIDATGNTTTLTRNFTVRNAVTPPKPGDLNGDGKVNITDLSNLLSNWGKTGVPADLNSSGKVDITDLSILLKNWAQ